MNSGFKIKGTGIFVLKEKDGKILKKIEISNTVVNSGLERIAKLLNGVSSTNFSYIGIGEGTTAVTNSDTALETEVEREQADSGGTYEADYKAIFEKTFTFSSGDSYAITEAGIFDQASASGSTMLDRFTFSALNVGASTDLYVKITVTVARS